MVRTITVNDVLLLYPQLTELLEQNVKLPINTALKLNKFYHTIEEIDNYVLNRLIELLPKLQIKDCQLDENEQKIYESILLSEIEYDDCNLTMEELQKVENLNISMSLINMLVKFF